MNELLVLNSDIGSLARSRREEKRLKEAVDKLNNELEIHLLAFPLAEALTKAKDIHAEQVENTNTIDANVRARTLEVYDLQQDKNVHDGVSVAEYTTFEIDPPSAIAWASEHHHKGLKLNLAEIKKVAKAGMEVDGVVLGKENRVKIASDLSGYLANSE